MTDIMDSLKGEREGKGYALPPPKDAKPPPKTAPAPKFKMVDEALREANKYFQHTLNLTRRRSSDSPTTLLQRPTTAEIKELKSGVERFGAYLHDKATAELDESMRLLTQGCDHHILAHNLHEQLKLQMCQLLPGDLSSSPWDAEWKKNERMPYILCYMLTRRRDEPKPKRRTQQQWGEVFLTNTKQKTQARATDASWIAAINDAESEAKDAWMLFCESSRLLREAARTETIDRHSMLREVSDRWCDLFSEHLTVHDVFEFHQVAQYDSILKRSILDVLQKLDKELRIWSSEEMAPRGKKIISRATDFDFRLDKKKKTLHDMQQDLKEARQFLRDQVAVSVAPHPAALPNAFAPMLPDTPTPVCQHRN